MIGLDLGQAADYTALAVLRRPRAASDPYDVVHLQRFPLSTPYPGVVAAVVNLVNKSPVRGSALVVDQTGAGRAVVDMLAAELRDRAACELHPVTITAGREVTRTDSGGFRVPKRELIRVLRSILCGRRLRIARSLPDAEALLGELAAFQVRITDAANEAFGAWRLSQHDDLVLAVALAAWMDERCVSA